MTAAGPRVGYGVGAFHEPLLGTHAVIFPWVEFFLMCDNQETF